MSRRKHRLTFGSIGGRIFGNQENEVNDVSSNQIARRAFVYLATRFRLFFKRENFLL